MSGWQFDISKTRERYEKLQQYYKQKGLNADQFSCVHYAQCSGSQKPDSVKQYAGGTAGLAPLYDVFYRDTPIRILIVGKESAYEPARPFKTADNFDVRSQQVVDTIQRQKRNPHIKGTLLTLQKIFEVESDFLYACYALSNLLRCAFQKEEVAQNVSGLTDTRVMRNNCAPYLIDEIKILEPTLIITQGAWAIGSKPVLVDRLAQVFGSHKKLLANAANGKYELYEFSDFMLITSHHPARIGPWKKTYAPDSLWPMLDHLKKIGYLPYITSEDSSTFETFIKSSGVVPEDT